MLGKLLSGSGTRFKYEHNPMDNPKAARDIIENPDAVYGFSPNPESTRIGKYADKIDWTNPEQVAVARQTREAYHNVNESMLRLEVIQEWMIVQDYMIFIMEENRMWHVQKKETFDIWTNNVCALKIEHLEDKCRVYVDYKGYNVIMPMGMWGFEDEIQDRKIEFEIDGEKGNYKSLSYVVKESDLKLFCDMIFFFLSEHNLDGVLNDVFKY